ncbi:MAG: hypothetical protein LBJ32_04310 [Oscillospiraceae bacterium]|jgi:hypothetical protein|nr:hypothetical protein [Oscillospiraceae bacterium]
MQNGFDIRNAFRTHGIELDQIEFSKLCEVLVESLENKNTDLEVKSSCEAVDFEINNVNLTKQFSKDCDVAKIHKKEKN